jgi:hypothetical protein
MRCHGPTQTWSPQYCWIQHGILKLCFFEPVAIAFLLNNLPSRQRETVKTIDTERGMYFPPEAWRALCELINRERSSVASQLNDLWGRVTGKDELQPASHVQHLALQRDAIGISFEIAGLADLRRQVFRKVQPVTNATKADSFISLMDQQRPQERMLLDHDRSVLETMVAEGKYETATYSEGRRRLRVWTVDKGPVERIAGVDLVILNQDFNSLLLLQYKCMELTYTPRSQVWKYYPNEQFHKEIARMKNVRRLIRKHSTPSGRMEDIRLQGSSLYFKFCKRLPLSQQDGELADGMFMSLSNTEALLVSHAAADPEETRVIGYDNCERYFNNSLFAALARDGWIGSRGLTDQSYKEILGLAQEGTDRSFVIAETHTSIPRGTPRVSRRQR